MRFFEQIQRTKTLLFAAVMAGLLTGCLDEAKLNTDTVTYTPEERPLGVLAGDGAEFSPGEEVVIEGRLTGTVTDQTLVWEQIDGTTIEGISDWTSPTLTFTAPVVEGIETFTFQISALDAEGNVIDDADGNPLIDSVEITIFDPSILIVFEVEDATVAEAVSVELVGEGNSSFISGASGTHTADIAPGGAVVYTLTTSDDFAAGFYTLYVRYAIPTSYGSKVGQVTVNGITSDMDFAATGQWSNFRVGVVKFEEGDNIVEVSGGWNYYRIDNIALIPSAPPKGPLAVPATLTNASASPAAVSLMEFLVANYGTATLSGQTEFMDYGGGTTGLQEFEKVVTATGGDAPAIVAFDLMDYSASRVDCGAVSGTLTEDMIAAHGGQNVILSPLWHWNAPMHLIDDTCTSDVSGEAWWHGFYTTATTFDLSAALADPDSDEYAALIADIDTISAELKKLADADIPVLWRPLHEAEGGWFWWGNAGADALTELWQLMYDRMTTTHGLNNLIWVYTHAGSLSSDWYPGDNYVDIVGYDGYDGNNRDNPFKSQYTTLKDRHNGKKMVALTETGTIPNVELMHQQDAWWSFFITWNSGGDYGPDGAMSEDIAATYAFDGVINLADIPGGRTKVGPGVYEGFEPAVGDWGAQVSWGETSGITTSSEWAATALNSLSLSKDLSAETDPTNVVFQVYPADGIDVSEATTVSVNAHALNAGADTTVYLFVKHGDDWVWASTSALSAEDASIEIDVSEYDWLAGLGVVFEGFDTGSTDASFFLDSVSVDASVLYDFEPAVADWGAQVGWSNTSGMTVATDWAVSGQRSLALNKDLSLEADPSNIVFQAYPGDGIDVSEASTISVTAHALNAGSGATAYLFVKHGDDWVWASTAAVAADAAEISIDVSEYDWLAGLGVVFEGFDVASTDATFYIDQVKRDDAVLYDFEGTGAWEFQVNWGGSPGIQLASDWTESGSYSLSGITQLVDGDDNIILQAYPAGGLLLEDGVATLKITANAKDAGDAVEVQLFAKDKDGAWRDGGAVALTAGGVELSLDVSDLSELSGFGVRFMGAVNSATESTYYIDSVSFE